MPRYMKTPELLIRFIKARGSVSQEVIALMFRVSASSVSSMVSRARKLAPKGKLIEFIGGRYRLVKDYTLCKVPKQMKLRRTG